MVVILGAEISIFIIWKTHWGGTGRTRAVQGPGFGFHHKELETLGGMPSGGPIWGVPLGCLKKKLIEIRVDNLDFVWLLN